LAATKKVIEELRPDVICLQETKVVDELFPHDFFNEFGYKYRFILGQPSYNGVAILSKLPCEQIESSNIQNAARHLAVRIAGMDLHNFYVPAGGDIPDAKINPKFADKLQFVEHMAQWLGARYKSSDKVILLGDLNIAPLENDVWSHKQLLQVVSHTQVEVDKYNKLQKSLAFIDAHRYFVAESEKLYENVELNCVKR
jgi:exodeoxyribonuclease-3